MSKIYSETWMEEQGFFDSDHETQQQIEDGNELTPKKWEIYLTEYTKTKAL